ncbi:MAG: DUF4347 domain-containing protein [Cyanobacteria bacterium P01_H01_bin.26]
MTTSIATSKFDSPVPNSSKQSVTAAGFPVVIFDSRVDDLSALLSGIQPGVNAHVLTPERDGIEQITEILQQQPTASLTLVAHGFPGGLRLGAGSLDLDTLQYYSSQLQNWFGPTETPQLTLLACNVAAGDAGAEFVERLQDRVQAKITASARSVGNGVWPSVAASLFTPNTLHSYQATLNWEVVSNAEFSENEISYTDLEVDGDTPYVVYTNKDDNQLVVQKLEDNQWVPVGTPEVDARGFTFNTDIELSGGVPYVAYIDDTTRKTAVIKFEGGSWTAVGDVGFSSGRPEYIDLEIDDNGTPYLLYKDIRQGGKAVLKKFVDGAWTTVGPDEGFSEGEITSIDGTDPLDLKIIDNIPYAIYNYADGVGGNQVIVKAFIDNNWVTVGNEGFAGGAVRSPNLESYNGIPYLVYSDPENSDRATVKVLENGSWVTVGNSTASPGDALSPDLEFDSAGTPYVVYADPRIEGKATVMKFDGEAWVSVGEKRFFSKVFVTHTDMAFDSNGIPYVLYQRNNQPTVQKLPDNVVADIIAPTLISITRQTPAVADTSDDTLVFQAVFSEEVQGVDAADFVLDGTSTAGVTAVEQVDATTYSITVSGGDLADFNGIVGLNLIATSDITDLAGNGLTIVEPAIDETYQVSNELPPGPEPEPEPGPGPEPGPKPGPETPPLSAILTPLSELNVVEITALGSAKSLNLKTETSNISEEASEVKIFSVDETGTRSLIGSFFLLEGGVLPADYSPVFNLKEDTFKTGTLLQFDLVTDGNIRTATLTSITETEVSLDFGDGTELVTSLVAEAPAPDLLLNDAAAINLTGLTGMVNVTFTVYREAALDNAVGFYTTDFADGGIVTVDPLTGEKILRPGDAGYKEAALGNQLDILLTGENDEVTTFDVSITSGGFLGTFVIIDSMDPTVGDLYFSHQEANLGSSDHIKHLGDNAFGIEDQPGLGDKDFNDLVVQMDFTVI